MDAAAAVRRRYARIVAIPRALGVPETAVVAGLERLDAVRTDPIVEIVADGVDPARALADHAFARRLLHRAGCRIFIDAGPLVVAPDLVAGTPSSAIVRAGRALAMQALSVELARGDGVPDAAISVGTLPAWLLGERSAAAIGLASIAAQRHVLHGLGLVFDEPSPAGEVRDRWWQIRTLGVVIAGGAASTVREADATTIEAVAAENLTAAGTAAGLMADAGPLRMGSGFDDLVAGIMAAAADTLGALASAGWGAIVGDVPGDGSRIAAGTTAPRREAPDVALFATTPAP